MADERDKVDDYDIASFREQQEVLRNEPADERPSTTGMQQLRAPVPPIEVVDEDRYDKRVYREVPWWELVPSPAAGRDFTFQNRYRYPVRIQHLYFKLVTSAVAGNRTPIITLRDSNGIHMAAHFPNVSQAASINRDWTFNPTWPLGSGTHSYTGTLGLIVGWIMPVVIYPYFSFGTEFALNLIDAGDQLSNIYLSLIKEPLS